MADYVVLTPLGVQSDLLGCPIRRIHCPPILTTVGADFRVGSGSARKSVTSRLASRWPRWRFDGPMQRPQKITLREMRADNGPRRLLVYCGDYKCAHSVIISTERWPDHVRLSDLEPKFTCKGCGHRGADIRPLFVRAKMGTESD
jgi:hypothetical protein